MENQQQDGKYQTQWEKSDTIKINVTMNNNSDGTPCQVADVAFNNQCYRIIQQESNMPFKSKSQFKSMIVQIGLECAEKQLGERKETLSKDFDILKQLKCKGGKPALLPLRFIKGKAYNKGEGPQK